MSSKKKEKKFHYDWIVRDVVSLMQIHGSSKVLYDIEKAYKLTLKAALLK